MAGPQRGGDRSGRCQQMQLRRAKCLGVLASSGSFTEAGLGPGGWSWLVAQPRFRPVATTRRWKRGRGRPRFWARTRRWLREHARVREASPPVICGFLYIGYPPVWAGQGPACLSAAPLGQEDFQLELVAELREALAL